MAGWPFWAATSDERIDRAFDLAALEPGEHLVDLGCGDGRVLLRAAALRGARVTGVELDPELAGAARRLLREHEVDGRVLDGDFADLPLEDVDVVYAYLSPATLQRLRTRLSALGAGARLVTTGYAVPGWDPVEAGSRCYLYRMPVSPADIDRGRRGWSGGGVLVSLRPDAPSLVAVKLHHPGGPVAVRVAGGAGAISTRAGADLAEPGDEIVVDLRFEARPAGTLVAAALDARGTAEPFQVFAAVDEGEPGVWGLPPAGCEAVGAALGRGEVASVLAEARAAAS